MVSMDIEIRFADLLRRCQLVDAIQELRPWLATASYKQINQLCLSVPEPLRRHAVLLIRDLLTGYPEVLFGAPVLIYFDSPDGNSLELPLPDCTPDLSVTSIAWLPLTVLRSPAPFSLRDASRTLVTIQSGRTECAVLVMQSKACEPPAPSDEWWGDAFRNILPDGHIRVSSRFIAGYPEAIECGCALMASAHSSAPGLVDTPNLFMGDDAYIWAQTAGQQWRENMSRVIW